MTAARLHADTVDDGIRALALADLEDALVDIFLGEIDDVGGSGLLGEGDPLRTVSMAMMVPAPMTFADWMAK